MGSFTEQENSLDKMFRGLILFQSLLFMFFMLENINTLDSIDLELPFDLGSANVNFFSLITTIIVVLSVGILASVSIFGAGLNASGSSLLGRALALITLSVLLNFASMYYLNQMAWLGSVLNIFFLVIYGLKGLSLMGGGA